MVTNISEYSAAAMYNEPEVQVFPELLKQLTTVQYVITEKQLFIEPIPYVSIHT